MFKKFDANESKSQQLIGLK